MSIRRRKGVVAAGRAVALLATVSLGACAQVGDLSFGIGQNDSEKIAEATPTTPQSDLEKATAFWAKKVSENPRDGKATLNYARNLKALGRKQEALGALQAAYIFNGDNRDYLSEYGRLSLDAGQTSLAAQLLERADDPAKPDWRVISARGTAMAKQGEYKEAIPFFERARTLAPNQASVMNNLAMAYTMDGQAERAEELLRQAQQAGTSDPRVQQNLALVLGLQGKNAEAKSIAGETSSGNDLPVVKASSKGAAPAAPRLVSDEPMTAPVTQVTATTLEPDEIVRAAMKAETARTRSAASSSHKRRTASADDAPSLKPSAQ